MKFRELRADEINVRVQSSYLISTQDGDKCKVVYLLYKDARCDMNILDETVGAENWQRNHEQIDCKLFCNVGIRFIRDNGTSEWVWKQDVGVESNTESEKGEASDSFKRACFNWGIGRELYTAPKIIVWLEDGDFRVDKNTNKPVPKIQLDVALINYDENKNIVKLILTDDKGKPRFVYDKSVIEAKKTIEQPKGLTKEQLEEQYYQIKESLFKNGLNIFDERTSNWLMKNAGVESVDVDYLNKDEIRKINEAMIHLLSQKKARG